MMLDFTSYPPQLGWDLRKLRKSARLSKERLAARVGVSVDDVVRWEQRAELPSDEAIRKLEEVYSWPLSKPPQKSAVVRIGEWSMVTNERTVAFEREMLIAGFPTRKMAMTHLHVQVGWPDAEQAARFLDIVTRFEEGKDSMYSRVDPDTETIGPIPKWSCRLSLRDEGECGSDTDFRCGMVMMFPPHDLPTIVERLKEYQ
jgi:transcriptional regulator with XRE-family HTH domain